jgi:hypothetical protein
MRLSSFVIMAIMEIGVVSSANAACLSDAEIATVLDEQIRSKSLFINTGPLTGKPLCSGLTLAQQVQRMREAAFPDERMAREAAEARQRALQAAVPASRAARQVAGGAETEPEYSASSRPSVETPTRRTVKAPPKSAVAYFDGLIAHDASSWIMNRYDRGSMKNMKIVESSNQGRTKIVYGEYTYNGGMSGWVRARFVDTKLQCLEFWDFSGRCRALGRSPSQGLALGFAAALASSSGDNSGSGSKCTVWGDTASNCSNAQVKALNDERADAWAERQNQPK